MIMAKKKNSNLGDVLVPPRKVPLEFCIEPESVLADKGWKYLKGAKDEPRKGTDGFTYGYKEGPMVFPDALDKPSRTIITGEGGASPSRFKHVVKFRPTKKMREHFNLDGEEAQKVRAELGLKKSEWLRRLTPIELERLNMFPDDHTAGQSDTKRAFFMGNALVTGKVVRLSNPMANELKEYLKSKLEGYSITVPTKYVYGVGVNTHTNEAYELRKRMVVESENWDCHDEIIELTNDQKKEWTQCGRPILGRNLWFGKPGKDWLKKEINQDSRIFVLMEGEHPLKDPPRTKLMTFGEAIDPFAKMMRILDAGEKREIYALLTSMRRPSTDLDYTDDGDGIYWQPSGKRLSRISELNNKIVDLGVVPDIELIDLLMAFEGIARNEDLRYLDKNGKKNKNDKLVINKGRGRSNNIESMLVGIELRLRLPSELDEPVTELWNRFVTRMKVEKISIANLKSLLGME